MEANKIIKNAGWLIGAKVIQSIISLIVSMLTARFLGPSNFGLINYAASIVAFVAPIMYLGFNGILVKEIVAAPEKEGEILGTAVTLSFISGIICIAGVISFACIVNAGETVTIVVCALYSILLLFQSLELISYWFQAKLLSKYYSIVSFIAYSIVAVYKVFLLITQKSVYWFSISNALDYMLISVMLFVIYKKKSSYKLKFSKEIARTMFAESKYYILSDMMVAVFAQTDKIMLKLMIGDSATGFYSAAVACSSITMFIFTAIIDSMRPSVFENKASDEGRYKQSVTVLYSIIIYLSLIQSAFITLFSGFIIKILYGDGYAPGVTALRIVVWYTTFSYIGGIRNIWLLAEKKQKYMLFINIFGALLNVVLNFVLIPVLQMNGAAIASLITQFFANVILGFIIKPIRDNNKLMMKALNPMILINGIKSFKRKKTIVQ